MECLTLRIVKKFSDVGIWLYSTKKIMVSSIRMKVTIILRRVVFFIAKVFLSKIITISKVITFSVIRVIF